MFSGYAGAPPVGLVVCPMKTIKLSKRLETVAGFVPRGARAADIGTDHGHLPVYFAQRGLAQNIIASDIAPGPLNSARRTAMDFGVSDRISFVLAPGLSGIKPGDADTIIIAGMGGETIINILSDAPWTKDSGIKLILSPQSKIRELCLWLDSQGYALLDASLTLDAGKLYVIILSSGKKQEEECGVDGDVLLSLLSEKRDVLFGRYIDLLIKKTRRAQDGLMRVRGKTEKGGLSAVSDRLRLLYAYKKEAESWQR